MNDENIITNMLFMSLIFMIIILIVLVITYIILKYKTKQKSKNEKEQKKELINSNSKNDNKVNENTKNTISYSKNSIYDFMEFDKIEDSMIVQKGGKRYIMVVECQGVNYDLMSQLEKISVEEGFQQFLNTLRHPIQIYIQTRTINLESSIAKYKERVKNIEVTYNNMVYEYNKNVQSGNYTREQLERQFFEVTKQRNMLEYSADLISNTEKMSLNKNVLNKKYYIVIPYYPEEGLNGKYQQEELKNMAFSELYTKAQAIIRTLSACSVSGRILNSMKLLELLYVAYNRDDSEVFGLEKALMTGYEDLYSTSLDVYEKKIKILDQQIENRAIELANEKIDKIKSRSHQKADEKEQNMDDLISKMAEIILKENKRYVGVDVANEAIDEIKKERESKAKDKEGEANEEIKKTTTRRRKKTTTA